MLLLLKQVFQFNNYLSDLQKQPPRGVPWKRCSENLQHLRHGCSPVNLLHIFRTPFLKNSSEWLLLDLISPLQASTFITKLFQDRGPHQIETNPFIYRENHFIGFYMIGTSVMEELMV